jgi:hypothetical protein
MLNWYMKKYKIAAYGDPPSAKLSSDGKLLEVHNSFDIKDRLKSINVGGRSIFWFGGNMLGKPWVASLDVIKRNPQLIRDIESIGVPIKHLLGVQPDVATPPQQAQPSSSSATASEQHISKWLLAKVINIKGETPGSPVVMAQIYTASGPLGWVWKNKNEDMGILSNRILVHDAVEFLPDKINPLVNADPSMLFQKFEELYPEVKQEIKKEEKKKKKGMAIAEDKISPYQKEIQNSFETTENNIVISALAGTGKTTMLKHLASLKRPEEKWVYIVYGRKNSEIAVDDFIEKPEIEIFTSHSFLGQRVLSPSAKAGIIKATSLPGKVDKSDPKNKQKSKDRLGEKIDNYINNQNFPKTIIGVARFLAKKLCSICKNTGVDPRASDIDQQILTVFSKYQDCFGDKLDALNAPSPIGGTYFKEVISYCARILKESFIDNLTKDDEGKIVRDHDDTLWFSALKDGLIWPKYDVVLVDEVQDFNMCQIIMLKKLVEQGARIIAVGDKNQAVFRFRGADNDSFDKVQEIVNQSNRGGAVHNLPVNYRCGKNIINFVNERSHVHDLVAGVSHDGEVNEGVSQDETLQKIYGEWDINRRKLDMETMFLARTNKPLIEMAIGFLKRNVAIEIIGNELATSLNDLVFDVLQFKGLDRYGGSLNMPSFMTELAGYLVYVEHEWGNKASKADLLEETLATGEAMQAILGYLADSQFIDPMTHVNITDTDVLKRYITKRFSGEDEDSFKQKMEATKEEDKKSFVVLASVHRSKGLESDRVFILDPQNFPHKKAKSPAAIMQEKNLWYVGLTRAKQQLNIFDPPPKS